MTSFNVQIISISISTLHSQTDRPSTLDESNTSSHSLGYERVYMPLQEVADTSFHIQGDVIVLLVSMMITRHEDDAVFDIFWWNLI